MTSPSFLRLYVSQTGTSLNIVESSRIRKKDMNSNVFKFHFLFNYDLYTIYSIYNYDLLCENLLELYHYI